MSSRTSPMSNAAKTRSARRMLASAMSAAGKGPCTSDFHIWEMLDQHRLLSEKHNNGDIFADIPKCKAFYDRFRALPQLEKYFASDDYKLAVNNPIANACFM
mmetsp:Transcript_126967/g.406498  ORF Transcript_126967/g.406498 Transcript_126967/m.406498 type:complete len:102 (-) Transcript_126967:64-369(-)